MMIDLVFKLTNNKEQLKKELRHFKLSYKHLKCLFDPYEDDQTNTIYLKYLKNEINYYTLVKYVSDYNKSQASNFGVYFDRGIEYKETSWVNNIFKFDLLIPKYVFNLVETKIVYSKQNDLELYKFLINNRNNIYCIFHKIYKFWFSAKNKSNIEYEKLYNPEFFLTNCWVRISRNEFKKYSDKHIKILQFLEENELINCNNSYSVSRFNQSNVGFCKGYRPSLKVSNLLFEKEDNFSIVRITSKVNVRELYYDFINFRENLIRSNEIKDNLLEEDEVNYYFLSKYDSKPKKSKITNQCVKLISSFDKNLIVTDLNEVYKSVEINSQSLVLSGKNRGKNNLLDNIYSYLNYFNLRYKDNDVNRFNNFNYFLDRTGRFYSFFNHCPKELVNLLFKLKSSKGNIEEVVEVDMRACHLNMFALLFNKSVLKNYSIKNFVGPDLLKWFEKKLDFIPIEQINAFKNLCSSRDYYEKITELINQKSEVNYSIEEIKKLNMYFLYGNKNYLNPIYSIFKLHFPFIIQFLDEVKKNFTSLSKLSLLLMRLESYFFINKGLTEIVQEGITVLPKHDCYYVAKSDCKKVIEILKSVYLELTKGDINYIPVFERNNTLEKVVSKLNIKTSLHKREKELDRYLYLNRIKKVKENLYSNLYYKDFNEFLIKYKILNLKVDKNLNLEKFKKIVLRFNKISSFTELKELEYFFEIFETGNYLKYIKKKYDYNFIKLVISEYLSLNYSEKIIREPVFYKKQIVSTTKILTPYQFYLKKSNIKSLKDRKDTQNLLLY